MKTIERIVFGALAVLLTHCATVKHGPMQRIRVASKPAGATVTLSECGVGSTDSAITPAVVFVNRRATRCTLTFTHPEGGTRTVSLLRTSRPLAGTPPEDAFPANWDGYVPEDPFEAHVMGLIFAVWGIGRGIDGLTGANYRQHHSTVVVNFHKPVPAIAGRYALVNVNGNELPAFTWTDREEPCHVSTNSGWLTLHDDGRWTSTVVEQEHCGARKRKPVESSAEGVYHAEADRILFESEGGSAAGVIQGDSIRLSMAGSGDYSGQKATYVLRLQPQ